MKTLKYRPRLESLEERTVPSDLTPPVAPPPVPPVVSPVVRTGPVSLSPAALAQALQTVSDDFEWMAHPSARSFVRQFFTGVYQDSMAAGGGGIAGANAQMAQHVGNWLGFDVVSPPILIPPPPPPVPPPPTDAGMTNTLPDANAPQWVLQQNGLKTWDVVVGQGDPVVAGDSITIFYHGWLLNGTSFDSKRSPDAPITFQLNGLIEGWKQGIPGMKPGGIRRLYVPSALGYGVGGSNNIPPNSDLIFEIKMISHT